MKFETEEFYIKSEEEMRSLFPQHPEAIENTAKIAELLPDGLLLRHLSPAGIQVSRGA